MEESAASSTQSHPVRVDIEYCTVCNSKPQCVELRRLIEERVPGAQVTCKTGRRGTFEVQINETLVHSKLGSMAFPDYEAVVENVQAAAAGKPVNKVKEQPITDCVIQCHPRNNSKKYPTLTVRFNFKTQVHVMRVWDYAYRQARKSEWEIAARDRAWFKRRIENTEPVLGPIFDRDLRERVYRERFAG
ncbi:uncharacterized protein LOC120432235 [Culex pipiens pallens]|uniref:uncharacterized protein LOC120432235 n=1 Tax=Culex pipiens pallens TaxID=42434 RepID=UPI001954D23C|nr:uncharacterized protein LOC120432235 [Culex pipiens pallens]